MPELLFDRRQVGSNEDRQLLERYHRHVSVLKRDALARRTELGQAYLAQSADRDPGPILSSHTGIGSSDLSALHVAQEAVSEARALIAARADAPVRSKGSLDYLGGGADFGESSPVVRLAWSPEVLCPVVRYFGMMPILYDIFPTRANAPDLLTNSSHMYHADPDDLTQVKVFLHLTEVDDACGPFHALPAPLSAKVISTLDYRTGRLMDEQVEAVVGPGQAVASVGPPGMATFCDTARCLHFGGRPVKPGQPPRDLLVIRYLLPTSSRYPQCDGDGEPPRPMSRLTPRPGDDVWNAFIGDGLC